MERKYEIRCPIHGFIELNEWERDIINQPAFQRLRRIRQLGLTDYVYPGAMHTRFEHSLGVMHIATRMYDSIVARSAEVLKAELGYNDDGLRRDRMIVRLAALLHDVGHAPLSHAAEEIMPTKPDGTRYKHEDYTAAIIRQELREVIDSHPYNRTNYGITAETTAQLIEGTALLPQGLLFWQQVVASQLDADRMDYLLRDAYHTGVRYGVYDLERLLHSLCAFSVSDELVMGVSEDGWHAVESLILARYYMFTQVYYHKTRRAYDFHIAQALKSALAGQELPSPEAISEFLQYDDWWFLGALQREEAGEHGKRIKDRAHYRLLYETPEIPPDEQVNRFNEVCDHLQQVFGDKLHRDSAEKSWYNIGRQELWVKRFFDAPIPLREYSRPIRGMESLGQLRVYVAPEVRDHAQKVMESVGGVLW